MTPQQLQADQLGEIRNLWLSLSVHQRAALVRVSRSVGTLGPVACELLARESERLSTGASLGDFGDDREYTSEALEEIVDNLHYLAAALLKLERARKRSGEKSSPRAAE